MSGRVGPGATIGGMCATRCSGSLAVRYVLQMSISVDFTDSLIVRKLSVRYFTSICYCSLVGVSSSMAEDFGFPFVKT